MLFWADFNLCFSELILIHAFLSWFQRSDCIKKLYNLKFKIESSICLTFFNIQYFWDPVLIPLWFYIKTNINIKKQTVGIAVTHVHCAFPYTKTEQPILYTVKNILHFNIFSSQGFIVLKRTEMSVNMFQ